MSLLLSRKRNEIFDSFKKYFSVFFLLLHATTRKIVVPLIVVCVPCLVQLGTPFVTDVLAKQDVGFRMPINVFKEYISGKTAINFLGGIFQDPNHCYEGRSKFSRGFIEFGFLEKLERISVVYLDKLECIKMGLSNEFPRKEISQDCSKAGASERDKRDYNIFHWILAAIIGNAIAGLCIYLCFKFLIYPSEQIVDRKIIS